MITGRCLCGAVRYESEGEPLFSVQCHCLDCRRASGTGHVPVMGVPKATFRVIGQTRSYALPGITGLRSIRHFCPTCGSLLFGTPEVSPEAVMIYVGCLDDPSIFRPQTILFARSLLLWDKVDDHLPMFDTLAPAANER